MAVGVGVASSIMKIRTSNGSPTAVSSGRTSCQRLMVSPVALLDIIIVLNAAVLPVAPPARATSENFFRPQWISFHQLKLAFQRPRARSTIGQLNRQRESAIDRRRGLIAAGAVVARRIVGEQTPSQLYVQTVVGVALAVGTELGVSGAITGVGVGMASVGTTSASAVSVEFATATAVAASSPVGLGATVGVALEVADGAGVVAPRSVPWRPPASG